MKELLQTLLVFLAVFAFVLCIKTGISIIRMHYAAKRLKKLLNEMEVAANKATNYFADGNIPMASGHIERYKELEEHYKVELEKYKRI